MSEAALILFVAAIVGIAVLFRVARRSSRIGRSSKVRPPVKEFAIVDKVRSSADPYPYVYVNADGSARELHPEERNYLETPFQGADGARPYVKNSYSQRNGWGELAGFLERSELPASVVPQPAPAENPSKPLTRADQIQFLRSKGMVVSENPDGTFTARKPKG